MSDTISLRQGSGLVSQDDLIVVIGAGEIKNIPGWIHIQESELNLLRRVDWERRFSPNTLTAILAEHVWEHFTYEEGVIAAKLCYEFLKPGGYVRCAVPDALFRNEWYQNVVKIGGQV